MSKFWKVLKYVAPNMHKPTFPPCTLNMANIIDSNLMQMASINVEDLVNQVFIPS